MGRNQKYAHGQTPHTDGRFEGPINDSLPDEGRQMGVRIDADPTLSKQPKNPFHVILKADPDMEQLHEIMNGREV